MFLFKKKEPLKKFSGKIYSYSRRIFKNKLATYRDVIVESIESDDSWNEEKSRSWYTTTWVEMMPWEDAKGMGPIVFDKRRFIEKSTYDEFVAILIRPD